MKIKFLLVALFLVTLLAACGSNSRDESNDIAERVLTILSCTTHEYVIRDAAYAMNQAWSDRPYSFRIEVEFYYAVGMRASGQNRLSPFDGVQSNREEMMAFGAQLMAGQGPDIFIFDRQEIHNFVNVGILADFYTLIDQDPNVNRDDFFGQALSAFEMQGGLYMLPVSFGFEYIGINANLPQPFLDRFAGLSTVGLKQMIDIYLDLMTQHEDEFGHMVLGLPRLWQNTTHGLTASEENTLMEIGILLDSIMGGFIDFDNQTANLTAPQFIDSLGVLYRLYNNDNSTHGVSSRISHERIWNLPWDQLFEQMAGERVFTVNSFFHNSLEAFITPATPHFIYHIPLSDEYGRLLLNPTTVSALSPVLASICIINGPNASLAWEFTQHLLYVYAERITERTIATPIKRTHFPSVTTGSLMNSLYVPNVMDRLKHPDEDMRIEIADNAIARIAIYNEMPMGLLNNMIPPRLYAEHLDNFLRGFMTADEFAQTLHNTITLWLME